MKYQFIDTYRKEHAVKKMCRVLKASRGGYYRWKKQPKSKRKKENEMIVRIIKEIHAKKNYENYGSPRMTDELKDIGISCGENRVARLMRESEIKARSKKKYKATTNSKHNYPVAPNLVEQLFVSSRPNALWLADITYIWTKEGWLYLAAVLDVCTRQIVGWAIESRQTKDLVATALFRALGRQIICPGLIHHSDRGVQYASHEYQKLLSKNNITPSMSKKGDCYDNAMMESFFHTLKTERVFWEIYETRDQAKKDIFEYIEMFYNPIRKHSSLGYQSPMNFAQQFLKTA